MFVLFFLLHSNVGRFIQLLRLFVPGKEVTVQSWLDPPPRLTLVGGGGYGARLNTQHLLKLVKYFQHPFLVIQLLSFTATS